MAENGKALTTGHRLSIMGNNCLKVKMHKNKVAAALLIVVFSYPVNCMDTIEKPTCRFSAMIKTQTY